MLDSLSSDERRDIILSIGTHKKNRRLSPIQVAQLLNRLYQVQGISLNQIAQELELKDSSIVRRFLSLLLLPPELQSLVNWGTSPGHLSFSVASEISRAKEPEKIKLLAKDALENQRSKEEVRAILQCNLRGGGSLTHCIETIDSTRPKVIHHYVFLGQLPTLTNGSQWEEQYSFELRAILSKLVREENVLSAAIKDGRFSFTLTESAMNNPTVAPHLTPEKLEAFVANLLMKRSNNE
ncbi:hypothetical protein Cylst_2475 [Cylindrospermum stagnale PCC 7417]|uniref:ParB/Spo0J HTH domain-containing protein n=1 Tax=Cylindrospermum stagnale PCC 7417 TaxID=56107 RepID=K9WWW1_9NOST|nr:hypothetical protein [Cylindrospermum stagnale]AFZ24688.1 hypothetical protein Cylst_2475 [Cylindrospermum stagnale PCC 7417]